MVEDCAECDGEDVVPSDTEACFRSGKASEKTCNLFYLQVDVDGSRYLQTTQTVGFGFMHLKETRHDVFGILLGIDTLLNRFQGKLGDGDQ